jgi:hypothetical protein
LVLVFKHKNGKKYLNLNEKTSLTVVHDSAELRPS